MRKPSLQEMQDLLMEAAETLGLALDLSFKSMFGGFCGYLQGRVFASSSDMGLALKLAPDDQSELLQEPGAERLRHEADAPASKQYIVVPMQIVSNPEAFASWVRRSADFVQTLPQPRPRSRKRKQA